MPIYLDHSATTPVDPRVAAAVLACMTETYGNASSVHRVGIEAERRLKAARAQVAAALGAEPGEITFTSGGTEADALAVLGGERASRGRKVICSAIEHPAVLEACALLGEQGFTVERVPVDGAGLVDPAQVAARVDEGTAVCAVMLANNELG